MDLIWIVLIGMSDLKSVWLLFWDMAAWETEVTQASYV